MLSRFINARLTDGHDQNAFTQIGGDSIIYPRHIDVLLVLVGMLLRVLMCMLECALVRLSKRDVSVFERSEVVIACQTVPALQIHRAKCSGISV